MLTPSLKKVTVPVGLRELAELTVAVNVTACPTLEGFALDATLICVANLALPTDRRAAVCFQKYILTGV
jgi:hypothetical protein